MSFCFLLESLVEYISPTPVPLKLLLLFLSYVGGLLADALIFGWWPKVVEWLIAEGRIYYGFEVYENYYVISSILCAGECSFVWAYEGYLECGSVNASLPPLGE